MNIDKFIKWDEIWSEEICLQTSIDCLEDDEKNEVLSFLLDQDENGASQFYKTLSDPNKLYEAAWFLRYGKESFDALKNAYESEIAKLKKQDKPTVVRKPKSGDTNKEKNIHDLF